MTRYSLCINCGNQIQNRDEYGTVDGTPEGAKVWYHRQYALGSTDFDLNPNCQNGTDPATTATPDPNFMAEVAD